MAGESIFQVGWVGAHCLVDPLPERGWGSYFLGGQFSYSNCLGTVVRTTEGGYEVGEEPLGVDGRCVLLWGGVLEFEGQLLVWLFSFSAFSTTRIVKVHLDIITVRSRCLYINHSSTYVLAHASFMSFSVSPNP